jgi:hypothetical protein
MVVPTNANFLGSMNYHYLYHTSASNLSQHKKYKTDLELETTQQCYYHICDEQTIL